MIESHELGKKAEALAGEYLQKNGYRILARNYRYLKAEVDWSVIKDDLLVGVEGKARSAGFVVAPHAAISPNHIQLLVTALKAERASCRGQM